MNKQEMDKAVSEVRATFSNARQAIWCEYAVSNNTVKIGDIVEDSAGKIKVDKIRSTFKFDADYPEMLLSGPRLKINGLPYKTGERITVYQSNILEVKK